ncbi:MAG: hypothetical protein RLO21_04190 [Nitratireductor sp.]
MTSTTSIRHSTRLTRREAPTHLFTVGQAVRLKDSFGSSVLAAGIYHITGTLPPRGASPQYRIRNDDERYERVTTQDSLEPAGMPRSGDGATLIERTFGHGQGTETKQSRDQETEAGKGPTQT